MAPKGTKCNIPTNLHGGLKGAVLKVKSKNAYEVVLEAESFAYAPKTPSTLCEKPKPKPEPTPSPYYYKSPPPPPPTYLYKSPPPPVKSPPIYQYTSPPPPKKSPPPPYHYTSPPVSYTHLRAHET